VVVNAATGGIVTFKAAGQTGVSIAVGESAFVYFNGTDYVKVSSTVATGVTSFTAGTTGLTPNTATTGAVTLAGTLGTANGGTNLTSFTSGGVVYASSTSALATGSMLVFDSSDRFIVGAGSAVVGNRMEVVSNTSSQAIGIRGRASDGGGVISWHPNGTGTENARIQSDNTGVLIFGTGSSATERARITSTGGFVVGTSTDPGAGIIADANGNVRNVPQSGAAKTTSYTLAVGDIGEFIQLGASGAIVIPDATFAAGNVVSIFNNTASTATITCSITTAYIAGTFTDKATMTLAAAGVATVLFISGTVCVVSGNVT
jgi:uncharacterized protein YqgC (DUF456 family)